MRFCPPVEILVFRLGPMATKGGQEALRVFPDGPVWVALAWVALVWGDLAWVALAWGDLAWVVLAWVVLAWVVLVWAALVWAALVWAALVWPGVKYRISWVLWFRSMSVKIGQPTLPRV